MRPLFHPPIDDVSLSGILNALADPVRLDIVWRLAAADCELSCAASATGVAELPKSTLSFHMRILREAGLIRSERKGTQVCNRLRCAEIEGKFPGLIRSIITSRAHETGRVVPTAISSPSPPPAP
jgi:DNA-binding transcriptional ArsR family regulator